MALVTNVVHGSAAERVLLMMHGFGADERDLGGLLPYLDPEGKFVTVLPRAPHAAPPGFSWFDLSSSDPAAVRQGQLDALAQLDDLLDATCEEHGFAREDAVVAGFSQGGRARDPARPAQLRPSAPCRRARDEPVRACGGRRRRRRLGCRAVGAGAPPARHQRPDDPGRSAPASSRSCSSSTRSRSCSASTRWRHEVALESIQQGRDVARRDPRRRAAVGAACPSRRPRGR